VRKPTSHGGRRQTGQALIEFTFVAFMMIVMLFGLIDFSRAIYERQVMINLTREGSNLTSRGTALTNAMASILESASPLLLTNSGRVYLSTVIMSNGNPTVSSQITTGGVSFTPPSLIGTVNNKATIPSTTPALPATNQTLYTTEIFYQYAPITPLGKLLKFTITNQLYDVAYF
jgi:Flp pilus assembly protein TadG